MVAARMSNKAIVVLATVIFVGWGLVVAPFDWHLGGMLRDPVPVDAIPDIGENQQIVFTEWTGRSPQDVEDQITYPLSVSLMGLPGVKAIRGYSMFGFSLVYVIFKDDVDFYWARTRVLESLNSLPARQLPDCGVARATRRRRALSGRGLLCRLPLREDASRSSSCGLSSGSTW